MIWVEPSRDRKAPGSPNHAEEMLVICQFQPLRCIAGVRPCGMTNCGFFHNAINKPPMTSWEWLVPTCNVYTPYLWWWLGDGLCSLQVQAMTGHMAITKKQAITWPWWFTYIYIYIIYIYINLNGKKQKTFKSKQMSLFLKPGDKNRPLWMASWGCIPLSKWSMTP